MTRAGGGSTGPGATTGSASAAGSASGAGSAGDLLVTGRIATLRGDVGFGWVEAIVIRAGRVIAAGTRAEAAQAASGAGPAPRLDLSSDEIAIPGFTDAHLHLGDAALAAQQLDLEASRTLEQALAMVAGRHVELPEGEWLLGHGWNGAGWGRSPAAADLDAVAPGRPIFLWSHDHHSAWLSDAALAEAGIARAAGASVSAGAGSSASGGVLHEDAVAPASAAVPPPTPTALQSAIESYARSLLENGIVAVHDPGPLAPDPELTLDIAACAALAEAGRLPIRVHVSMRPDSLPRAFERGLRTGDDLAPGPATSGRCRVGWLKLFADGALGSRTAAMLAPYEREEGVELPAGDRGAATASTAELLALVGAAAAHGIATQIHAIGDAAVRSALDAFAAAVADGMSPLPALPRIEHAQLVDAADRARFAALGVVASVQPSHLFSDATAARSAWGDRAERHGYPYGELHRAGAVLAFGSDAPVERADPWAGLAAAVWRAPAATTGPLLGADQRLAMDVALRAACAGAGIAAGDSTLGRLVPGSPADFLVVPAAVLQEPWTGPPSLVVLAGVPRA